MELCHPDGGGCSGGLCGVFCSVFCGVFCGGSGVFFDLSFFSFSFSFRFLSLGGSAGLDAGRAGLEELACAESDDET